LNKVHIRKANKSDYPMIKELVKELYATLDVKDGMDELLRRDKFEDILDDPKIEVLVAELNGLVIGYLTLNINKALLDSGSTAIIDELIVTNKYHGKGIGKKLVIAAIKTCKGLGCSEVGVGTEFSNQKAIKFYKDCGFTEIGVIFEKILK